MATTHLQLVNRILARLREDQVVSASDNDYAELVAEFVADAYEEVNEEHFWEVFKHRLIVDLEIGTRKYDLTRTVANGGGIRNSTGVAKDDTELTWIDHDTPEVERYDSDSDDQTDAMMYVSPEQLRAMKAMDRDETNVDPTHFTVYQENTSGTTRLYLEVYPIPAEASVMEVIVWTKPDRLTSTGSTDATNILSPVRPVYQLALMYALNERGEEMGEPGNVAERRYVNALGAAIEKDIGPAQRGGRYDWRRG